MTDVTAAQFAVQCIGCGARMRVPASKAGKSGKCPKCGGAVQIPAAQPPVPDQTQAAGPIATDDGRIKFACDSCGGSLKVPAEAVGRRVKCPKCQAVATVPDPNAGAADDPDGEDDMFAGLAVAQPVRVPMVAPPPPPPMAESRGGSSGGKAGALLGAAGAVGGVVANPMLLGILFSAIGAAIGGAVWCAIAYKTQYEIGWIAWGVGALAGIGMHLGFRDTSAFAGMVAAGMATLGIIGGKVAVFYLVLQPLFAALDDTSSITREELADLVARRTVIDSGKVSFEEDEEKFEAAVEAEIPKAEAEVAKLNDAQVQERAAQLARLVRDETKSEMQHVFWKEAFGLMDILFFALAIATAFRIGYGGFGSQE